MMDLAKKPRSPCLRLLASGESAKNAADHLGERAGIWPGCIDVESAEPDTFSILNASPPARDRSPCVLLQGRVRFGGFPGRGKTVANSACHHRAAPGEDRSVWRFPAQEITARHSRTRPPLPFVTAMTNLGAASRRARLTVPGLASASPGLFGKVLGQGVGALLALILNSNSSRTIRLADLRRP